MVAKGWALAYRQYSTAYIGQEDAAHTRWTRHLARGVHRAVGLAAWRQVTHGHREGHAAGFGGRLLQGLHNGQGVRQQLHQSIEDLPQAEGVRVRCAVTSAYCE
jgi:hypothetical protein